MSPHSNSVPNCSVSTWKGRSSPMSPSLSQRVPQTSAADRDNPLSPSPGGRRQKTAGKLPLGERWRVQPRFGKRLLSVVPGLGPPANAGLRHTPLAESPTAQPRVQARGWPGGPTAGICHLQRGNLVLAEAPRIRRPRETKRSIAPPSSAAFPADKSMSYSAPSGENRTVSCASAPERSAISWTYTFAGHGDPSIGGSRCRLPQQRVMKAHKGHRPRGIARY